MPSARNFCQVRFVWLLRAVAVRCCYCTILFAILASSLPSDQGKNKPHEQTTAIIALCSWQMIGSGFLSPRFLLRLRQEEVAHRRQKQLMFQPEVVSARVPVQTDLARRVLEAILHTPTKKCYQQQDFNICLQRHVVYEEFQLTSIKDISGHQQVKSPVRQIVSLFDRQHYLFAFPDNRLFFSVVGSNLLPRLIPQSRVVQQLINSSGRRVAASQTSNLAPVSVIVTVVWSCSETCWVKPTGEASRNVGNIILPSHHQLALKLQLAVVASAEREPIEAEPNSDDMIAELQANSPLGPVGHGIGNTNLLITVMIGVSALGNVQLTVQQTVELLTCETEVNGDDVVLSLVQPTDRDQMGFIFDHDDVLGKTE